MVQTQDRSFAEATGHTASFDAVVVGAGFSGLYLLWRLRRLGLSARVIETGDGVGGTWYWNRYPGARVDSPSMQYSLSFDSDMEQEWKWGENYSAQWELEKYVNHVADRFDLRRDVQFETTVVGASYDESTGRWIIKTDRGDAISAKYFITAAGCLSATNVPNFEGIRDYQGTWYHTSRWPRRGRRPRRQGGWHHRHGLDRHPGRSGAGGRSQPSVRLPAHGQLQPPFCQPAHGPRLRGGVEEALLRTSPKRSPVARPARR